MPWERGRLACSRDKACLVFTLEFVHFRRPEINMKHAEGVRSNGLKGRSISAQGKGEAVALGTGIKKYSRPVIYAILRVKLK